VPPVASTFVARITGYMIQRPEFPAACPKLCATSKSTTIV
jgi:hypothetical protein